MKKINVVRSSMPPIEEYFDEIRDIWETRWLTHTGPKHQKLTEELSAFLGDKEVSLFSNGHQALEAVFSLFPKGSEVITTPFTFASTTLAIVRCGLIPVFCDIDPTYYTLDVDKIENLITDKTVAICPVHVYGNLCDWKKIDEIAHKYNIKVIYDAAHAFGVCDGEKSVGELGDISMFSFHATKVFHTIEGGCLTYSDSKLSDFFASWRQFGMSIESGKAGESSEIVGTNAKLTEFAAAMGLCNLRHLEEEIELRKKAFMQYHKRLKGIKGLVLCPIQSGVKHNYAYMPVRIVSEEFGMNRNELLKKLNENNINARRYFYPLTSAFPICKEFNVNETPIAEKVSEEILCFPLYSGLMVEDVDFICDIVLNNRKI